MIPRYDLTVPPEQLIYCVVYKDPEIGDIVMPDAYFTYKEAKFHWRFNKQIAYPEDIPLTRIVGAYYTHFISSAYGYSTNVRDSYRDIDFLIAYKNKWKKLESGA